MNMTKSEPIPPPPDDSAQRRREMAALEADPRTSGGANRPPWLVKRVLADARKAGRL